MTDTTTHTETHDRFIYAPEGMAWIEGQGRHPRRAGRAVLVAVAV